ncbi:unnamed protein product [Ixodes persulcatus]
MKNALILLLATMVTLTRATTESAAPESSPPEGGKDENGTVHGRIWPVPGHVVYPVVKPVIPVVEPVYPVVQPVYPIVKPVYPVYSPCRYRCSLRHCELYQCHYKCIRRSDCFGTLGELDARKGNTKAEINVSRPVSQKVDAFDYVPPKP